MGSSNKPTQYIQNMSFANLKSKSGKFANLTKEIEKMTTGGRKVDERFWKPQVDKSGNGFAVIRFLPEPEGAELPWAQVWSHAFQGPGGWYIENSLTTLGQKDPVSALNSSLWNSGNEADKDVARKQKRKLSYYSNVYVVRDPKNPHNEGKVFLYRYGKKIFDKIMAAMKPEFQDETPVNPFDFWEGADFKLKIKTVAGFWNYDSSEFAESAALSGDDEVLENIYKSEHSLEAFTAPSEFKTYEALEARLNLVLGISSAPQRPNIGVDTEEYEPQPVAKSSFRERLSVPSEPVASNESDDDALSYFARLAEED